MWNHFWYISFHNFSNFAELTIHAIESFEFNICNDVLLEMKLKEQRAKAGVSIHKYNWHADMNNKDLNVNERFSRIFGKAKSIEESAKSQEKLLNIRGGAGKDTKLGEQVSDMFIDAIKAKLALLQNINESIIE